MPDIYNVNNVEEAVDLAYRFKEEGKYDWFRGQEVDYAPHSSLFRRQSTKNFEEANFKYQLFIQWVEKTEELKYLLDPTNVHELEAIMQHYGIPTHYIDFTTDPGVAGFFAADTSVPPVDNNSCIYCLNLEELERVWSVMKNFESRKKCQVEKIIVDVSNLWRLQAQHGVFLHCNYNLEIDYPLDKISFPYTSYPSYPTKDIIYPSQKSALELLLDQYFDQLRTATMHKELQDIAVFINWGEFPDGYFAEAFKNSESLKILKSWKLNQESWLYYANENYHITTGIRQKLRLNSKNNPEQLKQIVSFGIKQAIRSNPSCRERTVDWDFEELPTDFNPKKVSEIFSKIWNGMRRLSFDYDDISLACGNALLLYMTSGGIVPDRTDQEKIFSNVFGKSMFVGFANNDNTGIW